MWSCRQKLHFGNVSRGGRTILLDQRYFPGEERREDREAMFETWYLRCGVSFSFRLVLSFVLEVEEDTLILFIDFVHFFFLKRKSVTNGAGDR